MPPQSQRRSSVLRRTDSNELFCSKLAVLLHPTQTHINHITHQSKNPTLSQHCACDIWLLRFEMRQVKIEHAPHELAQRQSTWPTQGGTESNHQRESPNSGNKRNHNNPSKTKSNVSDIQPSIDRDWSLVLGTGFPHDTSIKKTWRRQKKTETDRNRQKMTEKTQKETSQNPYWYKTLLNQPLSYWYRKVFKNRCSGKVPRIVSRILQSLIFSSYGTER